MQPDDSYVTPELFTTMVTSWSFGLRLPHRQGQVWGVTGDSIRYPLAVGFLHDLTGHGPETPEEAYLSDEVRLIAELGPDSDERFARYIAATMFAFDAEYADLVSPDPAPVDARTGRPVYLARSDEGVLACRVGPFNVALNVVPNVSEFEFEFVSLNLPAPVPAI